MFWAGCLLSWAVDILDGRFAPNFVGGLILAAVVGLPLLALAGLVDLVRAVTGTPPWMARHLQEPKQVPLAQAVREANLGKVRDTGHLMKLYGIASAAVCAGCALAGVFMPYPNAVLSFGGFALLISAGVAPLVFGAYGATKGVHEAKAALGRRAERKAIAARPEAGQLALGAGETLEGAVSATESGAVDLVPAGGEKSGDDHARHPQDR